MGLPIVIGILYARGLFLFIFVFALAVVGLSEYFKALKNKEIRSFEITGYIAVCCYFLLIMKPEYISLQYIGLIVFAVFNVMFFYEIIYVKNNITNIAVTFFGLIYIPVFFSYILFIDRMEYGKILIWLPFLTAWFSDTSAYFVGTYFGKHKLCPKVSPKKTIEGAVGGIVGCVLLSLAAGYLIVSLGYNIPIIHFAVVGAICGATSQIGDLSASYIKRFCEIKDYGKLIPGHGGVIDRFDSVLFTAPTVFFYFLIVQGFVS